MTVEEKIAQLQDFWKRIDFNCHLDSNISKEGDYRLQGNANVYGTGTRSYNRSAEKREMDAQRKAVTEQYLASKGGPDVRRGADLPSISPPQRQDSRKGINRESLEENCLWGDWQTNDPQ